MSNLAVVLLSFESMNEILKTPDACLNRFARFF